MCEYVNAILTFLKFSSNLKAPPPVAQTVVTKLAIPFAFARAKKFPISQVGNLIKCNVPLLPLIRILSIYVKATEILKTLFFCFYYVYDIS